MQNVKALFLGGRVCRRAEERNETSALSARLSRRFDLPDLRLYLGDNYSPQRFEN